MAPNELRFSDRVVLVTGAGRGIGKGIAARFAAEGATVVLADRDGVVRETARALQESGERAVPFETDVADPDQVRELFSEVDRLYGRLDVSVHNAGVITVRPLAELSLTEWQQVLSVNTTGTFLCCQAAILLMRKYHSKGRILNAASGQARQGFIYTPHYAASKFGVIGLTQSLAKEVAREGITVNAFCPGIVGTDMWDYNDRQWGKLLGGYGPGELMAKWVSEIPMGRAGTPDDIANLLIFLASDEASYITGQAINVDGGMFMS